VRPVNLIPPEDRRGEQAPLRTGPLPYALLAALVVVLVGITAMVLLDNQIAESKSEVARLEGEDAAAAVKAQRLAAYTQFRSMSEQRVATVSSLADSRFDWERVMRELSLVLPPDVWLVNLTATASPDVAIDGGSGAGGGDSGGALRSTVPGPALELIGCASGQEQVAEFVTALKDIDGVTRVGVQSSELAEEEESGGGTAIESGSDTGGSDDECRTRDFIAKFELVIAFDAAPIPAAAEGEEVIATPEETAETASSETSEASEASTEGAE
jgi:Tfp pilus assembly protein PilN